jgi:hypothetical protein
MTTPSVFGSEIWNFKFALNVLLPHVGDLVLDDMVVVNGRFLLFEWRCRWRNGSGTGQPCSFFTTAVYTLWQMCELFYGIIGLLASNQLISCSMASLWFFQVYFHSSSSKMYVQHDRKKSVKLVPESKMQLNDVFGGLYGELRQKQVLLDR